MIVLSHSTAYLFWRCFTGNVNSLRPVMLKSNPKGSVRLTKAVQQELAALNIPAHTAQPLHCLVIEPANRSRISGVISHVMSVPLAPGAILRLSAHVCIVSPELCFLQMATLLSPTKLVFAGSELCSRYAIIPGRRPISREQITDAEGLARTPALYPGAKGAARARAAAELVFENAESPMEIKTAMLLCLPTTKGGYGLPRPALNPLLTLSAAGRRFYEVKTCRPDLFWCKARLDVEYDGDTHEGEESHLRDTARIRALAAEGVEVLVITYPQLARATAFAGVAQEVAAKLGERLRIRSAKFPERHAALREELGLR